MMKRIIFSLSLLLACMMAALAADKAGGVDFDTKRIDFGTVSSDGGIVRMEYVFTNNTSTPVSISTVTNGGCHCTKPEFSTAPILPGKKGVIKVGFDPRSYSGEVNREIKVLMSNSKKRIKLTFTGVVIPKK